MKNLYQNNQSTIDFLKSINIIQEYENIILIQWIYKNLMHNIHNINLYFNKKFKYT